MPERIGQACKRRDIMNSLETSKQLPRVPRLCSEVMRRPIVMLEEHATALGAARMMRENDIGMVAVCSPSGCLVGVLTDRDIATRLVAEDRDAYTSIALLMTRGAISCLADDAVAKAERLMREHRITRVLVTDERHCPVGVISLSDLAQYEPAAQVGRTLHAVSARKFAPERP